MTSAENLAAFAAMRALVIGHVFNDAEHGNIHHARHVHGLFNYHGNEILRRGNNNDACNRQGLEHRQGNIARSRRHVNKHEIDIAPDDIRVELFDCSRNNRAAPNDGVGIVFQQEVDAHNINARFAFAGENAVLVSESLFMYAEKLGDGGAGNIRIKNRTVLSRTVHVYRKQGSDERFADAALAADNGNDLFDIAQRMCIHFKILLLLRTAAGSAIHPAGFAIVGTLFAH